MDGNTESTGNNRNLPRTPAGTPLITLMLLVGLAANMAPLHPQSDALTGYSEKSALFRAAPVDEVACA